MGVPLGTAMQRVEELLDLPPGFRHDWTGESHDLQETNAQVWFVLGLALVIVYMVLASQFESLIHPITVILAVPLAAVGAFGLLWLLNYLGHIGVLPALPG
jgi:HAE1 family hydrophobic/amphiphilic exporter-1